MIKKLINTVFNQLGMQVVKRQNAGNLEFGLGDFKYTVVNPSANYAPWLADTTFLSIYNEIKENTLVDIYRCFELWELTEKIVSLNSDAHFLEIGVWRGGTAGVIGKRLSLLHSNINFYLADTFTGVKKASDKDSFYNGNEHADTSQEIVENLLKGKFNNYKILKGIFPEQTAHLISEEARFGLCHIDVDVYESSKDIVNWIWGKMIIGGVIIFDDYGFHTCNGVTKYVNEQKGKSDRMVIHNLNGHAVMVKMR